MTSRKVMLLCSATVACRALWPLRRVMSSPLTRWLMRGTGVNSDSLQYFIGKSGWAIHFIWEKMGILTFWFPVLVSSSHVSSTPSVNLHSNSDDDGLGCSGCHLPVYITGCLTTKCFAVESILFSLSDPCHHVCASASLCSLSLLVPSGANYRAHWLVWVPRRGGANDSAARCVHVQQVRTIHFPIVLNINLQICTLFYIWGTLLQWSHLPNEDFWGGCGGNVE